MGAMDLGVLGPPVREIRVQTASAKACTGPARQRRGFPKCEDLVTRFVASWNSRAWGSPSQPRGKASVQRWLSKLGRGGVLAIGTTT